MTTHTITLTEKELTAIIDSLGFLSCCDVCYDTPQDDPHEENLFRLKLARYIREKTKVNISNRLYITQGMVYEDEKEVDYLKENFNIREEKLRLDTANKKTKKQ